MDDVGFLSIDYGNEKNVILNRKTTINVCLYCPIDMLIWNDNKNKQ